MENSQQDIVEIIHERVFLTWANTYLSKRKLKAKSTQDFENGLMWLNLLELVSGKALTRRYKFELRPRTRESKITNTLFCLKFMEEEGVGRFQENMAELMVENDSTCVLSTLWRLLVFYHLNPLFPYRKDYRNAFLAWAEKKAKRKLSPASWASGEGFYRLCHAIAPHVMPPLKSIQDNLLGNMIVVMERNFQVPPGLICDTEFVQYPSDPPILVIMGYLARFRIERFKVERKKMLLDLGSDSFCCLSTLPEEVLVNVAVLMTDPLPWLFVNC